jgi:glutamyl-tRNA(Gln) amidotransferase subunit D
MAVTGARPSYKHLRALAFYTPHAEERGMDAAPGDRVRITTVDGSFEGILMPPEPDAYVLKLDTGYNIGIARQRARDIALLEKRKPGAEQKAAGEKPRKGLPTIAILHTGGTIASKVDYATGGVIAKFSPEEMLAMFPELRDLANIRSRLVRNMFSEDMRFGHYNILAKEAAKEIADGCDGIIITHGTDTLHYTGAALSFALQDLPVPVILVGAQRSSDRGSSDAKQNLLCAARFIKETDFAEVALCMHDGIADESCAILPGTKCRKMHTSRRDAFQAVNVLPWARVHADSGRVEILRTGYKKKGRRTLKLMPFNEKLKVGILKTHTHMYPEEFQQYLDWDGLVIEGTGLGHAPVNAIDDLTKTHADILAAVQQLSRKGTLVAMASQAIHGGIDMSVYSTGRLLMDAGVVGNHSDMTPETAFIKLAWLLSNHPKDARGLFGENIAGELSTRLEKVHHPRQA